ncbi:hypothetical protein [Shewanella surugensis]|uniref:Uncharacterized protein n=1 Tax=Shewanella surugensis TaxID=212020 RepID=A0ABT0LIX4_9GAMM|nr:hypothetical protein [Shewanella surugensis]MCL1127610.1 hypothetical protein [Shewanella surugensis]
MNSNNKMIILPLLTSLILPSFYSQAGIFNKIKKAAESVVDPNTYKPLIDPDTYYPIVDPGTYNPIVDPDTYKPVTQYLTVNVATNIPYIKETDKFVNSVANTVINEGPNYASSIINGGITEVTQAINSSQVIQNLDSGLNSFVNEVNQLNIPQTLGVLTLDAAKSWGQMTLSLITSYTDCLTNAASKSAPLEATTDGLQCMTQAVTMIMRMIDAIKSIKKIIRYARQIANGEHTDDLTAFLGLLDTRSALNSVSMLRKLGRKFTSNGSVSNHAAKQDYFGRFSNINELRNTLAAAENPNISYQTSLNLACENVPLPGLCEQSPSNSLFSRFDFNNNNSSLSQTEKQSQFDALMQHAYGQAYATGLKGDNILTTLNQALFDDNAFGDSIDRRVPYIVSNNILEEGPAALLYTQDDAIILLNEKFFTMPFMEEADKQQLMAVYLEELGHYLNFMRCKQTNNPISYCQTMTDEGADFSDGLLVASDNYLTDITQLTKNSANEPKQFQLANNGGTLHYETWPSMTDIQTWLAKENLKFRWRFRLAVGFKSPLVGTGGARASVALEIRYTPSKWESDTAKYYDQCQSPRCVSPVSYLQIRLADGVSYSTPEKDEQENVKRFGGAVGLARGHSITFPLVSTKIINDPNHIETNNVAYFDSSVMKSKANYSFSLSLYGSAYVQLFVERNPLPKNLEVFNKLYVTGYAGLTATWSSIYSTTDIAAGFALGSLGASIGCAAGYMAAFYGQPIEGCIMGSQIGEAMGVMPYASLSKAAKASTSAGLILSNKIKLGGLFSNAVESSLSDFGYDSQGSIGIEIRNELVYDRGYSQ